MSNVANIEARIMAMPTKERQKYLKDQLRESVLAEAARPLDQTVYKKYEPKATAGSSSYGWYDDSTGLDESA